MRRLVAACTLCLGVCLAALPARAETRVALVIGNSDYALISALANPENDAALMAETLRAVGFEVIEANNADRRGMARAIREFGKRLRRAGPEAVGLFYYAGHGVQASGANYLIPLGAPVDTEADLEIEAVSAAWVLGQMEYAGNALNVVILDACRNNPFKGSFRASTRGLARMNAPSGSLVAYAAAPGQVAADGAGANSPYTAALVAAMREPGLPLEQVFKRVRVAVEAATGEQQTPWEESSLKGDFYFVPQGSTVTVTPPGAPPAFDARALELALWETVKDSADPADFEDYLAQYPRGVFSGSAKRRLAALTAVAALPPAAPGFTVTEMDGTYYAVKRSNLRAGPGTEFAKLGRLSPGDEVEVTGKVKGKSWYRIAMEGGTEAFVFASLLTEGKPADKQVAVGTYPKAGRQPETFKDCAECPEMVVVPAGRFRMGDLSGGGADDEKPVHAVNIGYQFAVGRFEVTRGEFAAFVKDTGYNASGGCFYYTGSKWVESGSKSWRSPGFGQSDRDPVVCVSWNDAKAYLDWLGRKAGVTYRLLSEAEWEYAARAGTTTAYNTGSSISKGQAKYGSRDKTVRVGSYRPNAFGLYDVHGNVWEWVEDCWNDSYSGAPVDGSAWLRDNCRKQVLRGGSWLNKPWNLRSAYRARTSTVKRSGSNGFRVARTL